MWTRRSGTDLLPTVVPFLQRYGATPYNPMCRFSEGEKQVPHLLDSGEFRPPEEANDGPGYLDYHVVLLG